MASRRRCNHLGVRMSSAMPNKLIIVGAGGHGRVVADIAESLGTYKEIRFLDDNAGNKSAGLGPYPIVGGIGAANDYRGWSFFVAIGDSGTRKGMTNDLKKQSFELATLIHPSAVVSAYASIGEGSVVMPGAVVAPGAVVGDGCIVNTCASLDHDSVLSDWSHIAVGAHVAGNVRIGSGVWVGAGATIINDIEVCSNCMIGAGCVVVRDVELPGTYLGVPARCHSER